MRIIGVRAWASYRSAISIQRASLFICEREHLNASEWFPEDNPSDWTRSRIHAACLDAPIASGREISFPVPVQLCFAPRMEQRAHLNERCTVIILLIYLYSWNFLSSILKLKSPFNGINSVSLILLIIDVTFDCREKCEVLIITDLLVRGKRDSQVGQAEFVIRPGSLQRAISFLLLPHAIIRLHRG